MPIVDTETGEILAATPLDAAEAARLAEREAVIGAGLASFVDVGEALADVRDSRLYRSTHASFEDYCLERWGLSRKRSYDLMGAASVVRGLSPMGDTEPPANERQARELAPLRDDPERMAHAWRKASETAEAEGRNVTAADVRRAVRPVVMPDEPIESDEYDAIIDTLADADIEPTAEAVTNAVADAIESRRTPNIPTKPDLGGGISHPARYTEALLPAFAAILDEFGGITTVLDPFAGTGKIHALANRGYQTTGVELEPEWAQMHPGTIVGSALSLPFDDHHFDAIVTSPTYGNRLADSHNASDPERRRSYTHDLGRPLHADNSGSMQWGKQYRTFHEEAWNEAYRVLRPGGAFLLNIKDHIRNGKRQEVPAWHLHYLLDLGFRYRWHVDVDAPSLRAGANADARYSAETIYVLERAE